MTRTPHPSERLVRRKGIALGGAMLGCLMAVVLVAPAAIAKPKTAVSAQSGSLQKSVDRLVAAGVPGAILVVREGKRAIRISSGLGNVGNQTPMRPGDRFRIASQTKTYVATLILQLVGEGKLRLSDSVERHLPGLVPNGQGITIRQLLNHTSGLFDYENDPRVFAPYLNGDLAHYWPPRKLVEIAVSHDPLFAPGARQLYSNTNYILAGLIVTTVKGHSLRAELSRRIFRPLHLHRTTFPTRPGIAGAHAHGYFIVGSPPATDITEIRPFVWAAGAIVSTAADDLSFYRALLSGRLLRADLLRAMKTTVPVKNAPAGSGYGLGLTRSATSCGRVAWGHDGAFGGYYSLSYSSNSGQRQAMLMVNLDQTSWTKRVSTLFYKIIDKAYCAAFKPGNP